VRKAALEGRSAEPNIAQVFQQSRDNGIQHIPQVAAAWSPRLGLSVQLISEYLTQNVDYFLDQENLEGLRLFLRYGAECGVLPPSRELQFLEQHRFAPQS
jgi:predicted solute-binding protein